MGSIWVVLRSCDGLKVRKRCTRSKGFLQKNFTIVSVQK